MGSTLLCFVLSLVQTPQVPSEPRFGRLRNNVVSGGDAMYVYRPEATGDVDGDGHLDVVGGGSLHLWRGDGLGGFSKGGSLSEATDPCLTDVDSDGDLDLLAYELVLYQGIAHRYEIRVLLNDGRGRFSKSPAPLPWPFLNLVGDLSYGDFDGDGHVDIAIEQALGFLQKGLWLGRPDGTFVDASYRMAEAEVGDLGHAFDADGDGDLDFFGSNGNRYLLLENDGNARFTRGATFPSPAARIKAMPLADDLDGDGDVDVLVTAELKGKLWVFRNEGGGAFADATLIHDGDPIESVRGGDVDGDGKLDLLLGTAYAGGFRYLRNEGALVFREVPGPQGVAASGTPIPVDADGDGDLDVLFQAGEGFLFRNDGAGQFVDVSRARFEVPELTNALAVEDLDGDGLPDVVLTLDPGLGSACDRGLLMWNRGSGQFEREAAPFPDAAVVADVDADGDLDVIQSCNGVELWENLGGRRFAPTTGRLPWEPGTFHPRLSGFLEAADVDGDGDIDLVARRSDQQILLALNDGHGTFEDATRARLPASVDRTWATHLLPGDLNGDRHVDLLVLNSARSGTRDHVLFNDGRGHFRRGEAAIENEPGLFSSAALADMDGDGDLDLIGNGRFLDAVLHYFENDGHGFFLDRTTEKTGDIPFEGSDLVAVDVDEDGDLDVFLNDNRLLLNRGDGTLSPAPEPLPAKRGSAQLFVHTDAVAASDVDGDGDVDLLQSGLAQIHVNLTRQIAQRGVPALGKRFAIEIHGTPGAPWALHLAADRGRRTTDLGTYRLGPSAPLVTRNGTLDAKGFASVRLRVPDDPSLAGREAFAQALVGTPLRLTNLEILDIVDL